VVECIPCTPSPTSCKQTTRRNSTQYTVRRTCGCDATSARHRRRCRRHSSALREATVGRRVETAFEHTLLSHPVCYLCARLALAGSRAITSSGRALRATGFSEPLTTSDQQRAWVSMATWPLHLLAMTVHLTVHFLSGNIWGPFAFGPRGVQKHDGDAIHGRKCGREHSRMPAPEHCGVPRERPPS
jgi:hypothetical protein